MASMNIEIKDNGDTNSNNSSTHKKRKIIDGTDKDRMSAFEDFRLIKVLREDDRNKLITLHGVLPIKKAKDEDPESEIIYKSSDSSESEIKSSDANAVVLLERKPFESSSVEEVLQLAKTEVTLQNDIYHTYDLFSMSMKPDMKATLIFPATEKHISKYSEHEPFIVHETPQLYKDVTLPCIEASKFSIQWVYNILEKKKEADRIVEEDPDPETGFVMVPDMKWDRTKVESLYLVAIVHNRSLRSIRDLRGEHLPLLRNVLQKGKDAIKKKFDVDGDKLRIYFHYQPSYYHLHIHFTHIKFDAPGSDVMRAHLLSDVTDNLSIDPDFYNKKTLSYVVRDGDQLYKWYKEKGYFNVNDPLV